MATVMEEGVTVEIDRHYGSTSLKVPHDLPFTVATIQATCRMLTQFTDPGILHSEVKIEPHWNKEEGLHFEFAPGPGFDISTLMNAELPLRATGKPEELKVRFIDPRSKFGDRMAVLEHGQVMSSEALTALCKTWTDNVLGLADAMWFGHLSRGCFALHRHNLPLFALSKAAKPTYSACGDAYVWIYYDRKGCTGKAKVVVRTQSGIRDFRPNIEAAQELPGFSDLIVRGDRNAIATYSGSVLHSDGPASLAENMEHIITRFMLTLGIHPMLGEKLTIVLDRSALYDGSHDGDVEIAINHQTRPYRR